MSISSVWLQRAIFSCACMASMVFLFSGFFEYWSWQEKVESTVRAFARVETSVPLARLDLSKSAFLFQDRRQKVSDPVKKTTLAIRLNASYVSGAGRSAAVLSSRDSEHRLYYQGDEIEPGVELVSIQARRVLIRRHGALESIALESVDPTENLLSEIDSSQAAKDALVMSPTTQSIQNESIAERLNRLRSLANREN